MNLLFVVRAAGIILDDEGLSSSLKNSDCHSPLSVTANEASEFSPEQDADNDEHVQQNRESNVQYLEDHASEVSEVDTNGFVRSYESYENGKFSPKKMALSNADHKLERSSSSVSLFSSVKSMGIQDGDYEYSSQSDSGEFTTNPWDNDGMLMDPGGDKHFKGEGKMKRLVNVRKGLPVACW